MSRLSREKKREQKRAAHPAALVATPVDVHVPVAGPAAGGASIGGVPLVPAAGEEIQQAVLDHLHRIAVATGTPVRATIHDERIGCVVHLQVAADGSSTFTGEPVRMPAVSGPDIVPPVMPAAPAADSAEPPQPESRPTPYRDKPTHLLRPPTPEPVRDASPTFPLRAVSEPLPLGENVPPTGDPAPTFTLRKLPAPEQDRAPGTVVPPAGQFGPPPPMDAPPHPTTTAAPHAPQDAAPYAPARHETRPQAAAPAPQDARPPAPAPLALPPLDPDPQPTPTPARGFDAVAEAVLGDEPPTAPGFLLEPMTRINEAVKAGRIAEAGALAVKTVGEASAVLGSEHGEVLKLRELTAYIAYLGGDPERAFRLSIDLARVHRRLRDAEGAYGNVRSAASAWRAVRDPHKGLEMGRDLIGLWTELAAEDGPAAEDIEDLESARARMGRLTERARNSAR
jgi:hypothetical protein